MEIAGDFHALTVVGFGINANRAGKLTTGPCATDAGPVTPERAAAAVLREQFVAFVFDGENLAGFFFDADVEDAVVEEESLRAFLQSDFRVSREEE